MPGKFEKKAVIRKNENNCKFVCVYSGLLIVTNYFRSFVSWARGKAQDDKTSSATGGAQDDKEGFPLKALPSFRLTRRADRDKKTPQTNII